MVENWIWLKTNKRKLSVMLARGERINDELLAIAEAAQQRLSGIPDDHDDVSKHSASTAAD